MPNTHNVKMGNYSIKSRFRNVFRYTFPYFVGDVVKFDITINVDENGLDGSKFYIKEIFNGEVRQFEPLDKSIVGKGWIRIETHPIDQEGDVRYKIGFSTNSDSEIIVSARAKNTDRWLPAIIGMVVTAVLTFLVTIASGMFFGFIDIQKFWSIWIP